GLGDVDERDLLVELVHDLRSPLTSILFLAETLRRGQSGEINDIQRRQLGIIYSAALGLISVAGDVIELARGGDRLAEAAPAACSRPPGTSAWATPSPSAACSSTSRPTRSSSRTRGSSRSSPASAARHAWSSPFATRATASPPRSSAACTSRSAGHVPPRGTPSPAAVSASRSVAGSSRPWARRYRSRRVPVGARGSTSNWTSRPSPDPAVPSSRPIVPPCCDASTAVAAPLQERALIAICLTPSQLTPWCGRSPGRPALVRRAQRLLCPAAPATRPVADESGHSYGTTVGIDEQRADGTGDSRQTASPRVHAQRASRDGEAGADRGSAAAVASARQSGSEGAQRGDRR